METGLAYSCGLILVKGKPTLKAINSEIGMQIVNLSDFLCEDTSGFDIQNLFRRQKELCENNGELVIDEVIVPKENTENMETRVVHCSCQNRQLQGQEFLVLIWTKGKKTIVVGLLKIEGSGEEGKLNKAVQLVDEFLELDLTVKGLRVDGWFFKEIFWKKMKSRGIDIISKPRRDSKWFWGTELNNLKEHAQTIPKESFHYYTKEQVYAKGIIVATQKYGYCKIVIIKPSRSVSEKDWRYIVSSNTNLSVREIMNGMKVRWKIEVIFRDCSQNLGLKNCQCYRNKSSYSHVALVFLTYNYLSGIKEKEGGSIGKLKRKIIATYNLERTNVLEFMRYENVA